MMNTSVLVFGFGEPKKIEDFNNNPLSTQFFTTLDNMYHI